MDLFIDIWIIIFLAIALHGAVLSVLFFRRKEGRKASNVLLGIFVMLFTITVIAYVGYLTGIESRFSPLSKVPDSFVFLFGPVIYLYVISILKPQQLYLPKQLIHFLPFAALLLLNAPLYLSSGVYDSHTGLALSHGEEITRSTLTVSSLKVLHMVTYAVLSLLLVKFHNFRKIIKHNSFHIHSKQRLKATGYCFLGFVISYSLYAIIITTPNEQIPLSYLAFFTMAGFTFAIGYLGYLSPQLLSEIELKLKIKYRFPGLEDHEIDEYFGRLLDLMHTEKLYRIRNIRIKDFAVRLNIPSHYIPKILKETVDKDFFEFINIYRVNEAKSILSDSRHYDRTIHSIAFESGFSDKASFCNAFKKEVGITPSNYREKHQGNR